MDYYGQPSLSGADIDNWALRGLASPLRSYYDLGTETLEGNVTSMPKHTEESALPDFPERERQVYDSARVAKRIRLLVDIMRNQAEWSQADFARKVEIGPSRLSHYLNGTYQPQTEAIARICWKLGISAEWLIFGSGPMWQKDLPTHGIGIDECVIALSSVLVDVADHLRRTVVTREGEDSMRGEEIDLTKSIHALLAERLQPAIETS